jgi:hypothetical protein
MQINFFKNKETDKGFLTHTRTQSKERRWGLDKVFAERTVRL